MVNTKMNFFQQIRYAITKPLQYYRLTRVSTGRMTGFVFIFTLIISLFTIIPVLYSMVGPNGFTKFLREDLPAFEMSNGELTVDGRYDKEEAGTHVLVDTTIDKYGMSDLQGYYNNEIMISKTNMIISQYGRTQMYDFARLKGIHFNNSMINGLMPFIYLIFFFLAIMMYIGIAAAYFLTALLYSFVGLIVAGILHANLRYTVIFKTAIYGKVTACILSTLLGTFFINLPGFLGTGLSIVITCAYVVYGTLSLNSDAAREEAGLNLPPQNPYNN